MEKIIKRFPLLMLTTALSIFMAVGAVGIGNVHAAPCGDTDLTNVTDTICNCGDTVVGAIGYRYDHTLPGNPTSLSLMCPSGDGLIIGSADITIDGDSDGDGCGDWMIDGIDPGACSAPKRAGIFSNGDYDNVTIKNLEIKNFCTGIHLDGTGGDAPDGNIIECCRIHDNGNIIVPEVGGILLGSVNATIVTKCEIYNNIGVSNALPPGGFGIYLFVGANSEFTQNYIHDNLAAGIFIRGMPYGNTIKYNAVENCGCIGIAMTCMNTGGTECEYNYCNNNGGCGMLVNGSMIHPLDNTVRYNVVENTYLTDLSHCPMAQGVNCSLGWGIVLGSNAGLTTDVSFNTSCNNAHDDIGNPNSKIFNYACNTCDNVTAYCQYACSDKPTADFHSDVTNGIAPLTVQFTDDSTATGGKSITAWEWSFGDCTDIDTHQNAHHIFDCPGTYTVCLTVTDSEECNSDDKVIRDGVCQKHLITVEKPNVDLVVDETGTYAEWINQSLGTYKVNYKVTNNGNISTGDAFHVCLDIDNFMYSPLQCSDLGPGLSCEGTFDGPFNCDLGSDIIKVYADHGASCDGTGVIVESDETNNLDEDTWDCYVPGPDLVVTAKKEVFSDHDTYRVLYTVKNKGDLPAEEISRTCVYIEGVLSGKNLTPALGVNASIDGMFGPFRYDDDGNGSDNVTVCADCEGDVNETYMGSGELNNCLKNILWPDLHITDTYGLWDKFPDCWEFWVKFHNQGTAPSPMFNACVEIDGEVYQTILVPDCLNPCDSIWVKFKICEVESPSITVTAIADCGDGVVESDETNNEKDYTWSCYAEPDLVVSGLSIIDNYDGNYTAFYTVKNIGSADAGASHTSVRTSPPGGSVIVGTNPTPGLAPNESVWGVFNSFKKPGKNLKVCADMDANDIGVVPESDELNNCRKGRHPCTPTWPDDLVTLDVRNGVGVPGSNYRVVEINLDNSFAGASKVSGVEIDVMEFDVNGTAVDDLEIREAVAAGRAMISGFTCSFSELENGAVRIALAKSGNATIKNGDGPIITMMYWVSQNASSGECIDLFPINIKVLDDTPNSTSGEIIPALGDPGKFCFTKDSWGDVWPAVSCGDGLVNIYDILEEIGIALGAIMPSGCQLVAGDVPTGTPPNCVQPNEVINILDVLIVIEKALGIPNCADSFSGK